ncbi:MAG TPA: glycoside hydrolase family 3 N-terminal domain-containing protein [Chitinophagaceae bacterium]|nr:serine hydrolase [Chitinophagaceae bacterium]HNF28951.1 glycoside hydrolase family 3 N-terminal domain-containing protein [Chitinophagaceae bacterium]HNM33377.1 glycoside hydrolase family 3 N-terminal domain-containing protein [Chitinophagaceae bacterium]HNN31370.1 glycoside hydrolase family 3 N-terminal domain-containing protein [Chitinophagaceae bacterium]
MNCSKYFSIVLLLSFSLYSNAQKFSEKSANATKWADSIMHTLTNEQKIAQLMIVRAHSNLGEEHIKKVTELITQYNIGGLCFFQGGPIRQANLTNYYQSIAKTPLMICIDAEWGLGMRLDSVIKFPRQLMLGAVQDVELIYQVGKAIGLQCKRLGIHVNYAPVIDINNNANNPVINDRSFGEDKNKVALFGTKYMQGMQDVGVMACAKHFPGHGDVNVDSHYDLPVINKTKQQLDSLELYPFKQLIKAGVGSIMIAHLFIPSIDSTPNLATSLSKKSVTELLRKELGYNGITFTDGLEMQGVKKFFPDDEVAVQSLVAGNDLLCLPENIQNSISKIITAINNGRLTWQEIDEKVYRVLIAKYNLGLHKITPIETENITADIDKYTNQLRQEISKKAITVLKLTNKKILPLFSKRKIAYIGVGINQMNSFAAEVKEIYNAKIFLLDYTDTNNIAQIKKQLKKYKTIIVGLHNFSRRPANNFGINTPTIQFIQYLAEKNNALIFAFGNPYVIKNFCEAKNLIACYEDDNITQLTAANLLQGKFDAKGKLPVTVCNDFKFGDGITYNHYLPFSKKFNSNKFSIIDTIALNAIHQHATPGLSLLVAKKNEIIYYKNFGFTDSTQLHNVTNNTIYDVASITKVAAVTVAIMKLYDEGKIELEKPISNYLPYTLHTNKANITIKDLLLHQSGLVPFISFYKQTIDTVTHKPLQGFFNTSLTEMFTTEVAANMFLVKNFKEKIIKSILDSELNQKGKYVYSDNNFILLAFIIEAITQKTLNEYVQEIFYKPLQMTTTVFNAQKHFVLNNIAPTELDKYFRQQLIQGYVHDEGAAMLGGVAGNAGLFSNAYDLLQLFQMLLNKGSLNGVQYISEKTINLFTSYQSNESRRGLGFDKPLLNNAEAENPYPCYSISANSFGHTGFTGTCVWVDADKKLIFIFLSNRIHPSRENKLLNTLNVRSNLQETFYNILF